MVRYSNEILHTFGAPMLPELTGCGAKELPEMPDYLSAALWNYIVGYAHPDPAVLHLDLTFVRRTTAASAGYKVGRDRLLDYVEGVGMGKHHLKSYLAALTHFEQCIGALWQAAEIFDEMQHRIMGVPFLKPTLYKRGDKSDLQRINELNNVIKHFSAAQAERASAPVWITNTGLECDDAAVTFDELHENLLAHYEVAQQTIIEIPKDAHAKKKAEREAVGASNSADRPPE